MTISKTADSQIEVAKIADTIYGVVPLPMECRSGQVDLAESFVAHFAPVG